MNRQSISFEGFVPFGTKLREQTVPLGNAIPVGAEILEKTADKLTIRVPECGGGVLLTGLRGKVGGAAWNAANWLAMDVNFPQPEQFALCLCVGVYRYDQEPWYNSKDAVERAAFPSDLTSWPAATASCRAHPASSKPSAPACPLRRTRFPRSISARAPAMCRRSLN